LRYEFGNKPPELWNRLDAIILSRQNEILCKATEGN
jgi:hypothetical protein